MITNVCLLFSLVCISSLILVSFCCIAGCIAEYGWSFSYDRKFVKSIKKKYRERLLVREEQWPPVSGDKLINLQLVEADKKEGFRGGLPQHGAGGEKIKRTPILYDDLFRCEEGKKPVRKVLVEGNSGMGKTTLCTMLCEEWAEGSMLMQFDYVLLLPLREKSVAEAKSLPDLFKLLHSCEKIRTSVVNELKQSEGERVLIIADGWDELEEARRSEDSFLYKLLVGDVLSFASILLTSRPSASAPLHSFSSVNRLVEVVGFTEKNIKQYIVSEFKESPGKASGLIQQLDNNPLILNVCSVPLNCAIVCNLWHTLEQVELPSTVTELYTKIILNVILRDIKRKSPDIKKKFPDFPIVLSLSNFDSIPSQLEPYWWLTCKFAFETLSNNQLVFTEEELAEGVDPSQMFLCFGVLQSARSLLPVGHGLSFHFLHKTFQEYLAALHLVTLPTKEQLESVRIHAKSSQFDMVWRFLFGLGSKKKGGQFSKKVVCLGEKVMDTFLSSLTANSSMFFIRYGIKQLICHCALESQNNSVSSRLAEHIGGRFDRDAFTPHDCVAVLHVLSKTSSCDSVHLYTSECGMGDKQLRRLTDVLFSAVGELKVEILHLSCNKLTSDGVSDLFTRALDAFSSLEELSLRNNNIKDGKFVNSIVSSLVHISCKSLTQLFLSGNRLGKEGMMALEIAAQAGVLVNLSWLHLENTLIDDDAEINGKLLTSFLKPSSSTPTALTSSSSSSTHESKQPCKSQFPCLVYINLSRNNLGVSGACALGEALPLLCTDKKRFKLNLNETKIDNEAINVFAKHFVSGSIAVSSKSAYPSERLYIDLDGNKVSDGMVKKLEKCLNINTDFDNLEPPQRTDDSYGCYSALEADESQAGSLRPTIESHVRLEPRSPDAGKSGESRVHLSLRTKQLLWIGMFSLLGIFILTAIATLWCWTSTLEHKISDVKQLHKMLDEIGDWEALCTNLDVNCGIINNLIHTPGMEAKTKKKRCLEAYYNSADPTWEKVILAISGSPIHNERLANKIAMKYGINYNSLVDKDEL